MGARGVCAWCKCASTWTSNRGYVPAASRGREGWGQGGSPRVDASGLSWGSPEKEGSGGLREQGRTCCRRHIQDRAGDLTYAVKL
jgi:hypothetical protein